MTDREFCYHLQCQFSADDFDFLRASALTVRSSQNLAAATAIFHIRNHSKSFIWRNEDFTKTRKNVRHQCNRSDDLSLIQDKADTHVTGQIRIDFAKWPSIRLNPSGAEFQSTPARTIDFTQAREQFFLQLIRTASFQIRICLVLAIIWHTTQT